MRHREAKDITYKPLRDKGRESDFRTPNCNNSNVYLIFP